MAVLPDNERASLHAFLSAMLSRAHSALPGVLKADFRAAVNAVDDWAEANKTSFNNALPTAFKDNASAKQKALLLAYVILKRYEVV